MLDDPQSSRSAKFWHVTKRTCQAVIAISFVWLVATSTQPIRLNWGDPWSDIDIMTAGRFMAEDGFLATKFTPIVDIKPLDELSFRYVHYPPLAEIINGAVQRVTGSDSLTMFRLIFTGFSALSVWFLFCWVRRIWGERVAWVAAALFASNSLWLKYADCIHSHPLHLMTGFGALWWLTRWIDQRRRRDLAIFVAWSAAAFMSSYDYYLFLPFMITMTPWLLGHPLRSRMTLLAMGWGAIGCGAGLALKFGLALWALGWKPFLHDLRFQFLERATDHLSYKITTEFYKILILRHVRFFSPIFMVVFGCGVASLFIRRLRPYVGRPAPWVLLFGGLLFVFAMKQLFCEQYHVSLSLLPYFSVAGALLFVRAVEHRVSLVIALVCAATTYGWHVKEVATFEYAFLEPAQLEPFRAELDANDQHNKFLYSSLSFTPSFRYSLNKHMISIDHVQPRDLANYFEQSTRDLGGHAPYFVHYEPFLAAAEDTKIVAFYAGHLGKLWWLRDPWWTRKYRAKVLRERVDKQLEVVRSVCDKVMESGAFTLYRINPEKLRDVLYPAPTAVPPVMTAASMEFARAAGAQESISAPGKYGDLDVRFSLHHRPIRPLIVAGGGSKAPPANPALDFELRLPRDPARDQRVAITLIPLVAGTTLELLGSARQTFNLGPAGTSQRIELILPAQGSGAAVAEQQVRFSVDKIDESGRGIAIEKIELEATGP
ncbi:MAG: ArnT family glycosyltransferase [Kofleriaceae bacterium]